MSNRRVITDVEEFDRRRAMAPLPPGDSLDPHEVEAQPHAALAGGLVLALLICGAAVVGAHTTARVPDGWSSEGTLILDPQTGARFLADGAVLHPAPTLTGALLAGARPVPVLVPHEVLARAPLGAALVREDVPERPPQLPATPTGFTACLDGDGAVDVHAGAPVLSPAVEQGLLVRTGDDAPLHLVTARRAHPVTDAAVTALGYSPEQVRQVPAAWLALVPTGQALDLLASPAPEGARGVAGVGAAGEVVTAAGSGRRYLIQDGAVRPLADRTSELLAPEAVREVADEVLSSAPGAPPLRVDDAPRQPPPVPPRGTPVLACVRSSDGLVTVNDQVADAGTQPSPTLTLDVEPAPLEVTWHFPPAGGALVGPLTLDAPVEAGGRGTGGIRVVADGVAHEVIDLQALRALGYRRDQTVLLPDAWLRLLARGGELATPPRR